MSSAPREPGATIGRYRVVGALGVGGSGKVYRVEDPHGNIGALKLIDDPHDTAAVTRLRREMEALKALRHPAVPVVLDAEFSGAEKYVVYQFVEGPTLTQSIAEEGPLQEEELATFAEVLNDALAAVHQIGVVHRDVTPSNVMMTPTGPVLIDFGLAQEVGGDRLTRTGLVSGTVGYVAPEVIDGHEPDEAADYWAWAAVVAYAAAGQSPFGAGKGAIRRTIDGEMDIPDIVGADALAAALHPEPSKRPGPEAVIAALRGEEWSARADASDHFTRHAREGEPQQPSFTRVPEKRRGMIAVWALAIGLLATVAPFVSVGLATVFAWAGRTEHRRTTNAVNFHAKRPDKRGNEALATVGLPWHMVRALVELVPSFITAAVAGVGIVTVGWWLVDSGLVVIQEGPTGASWSQALFLALGGLAFVFLLWWGPWSRATRQGGARVAYALSRVDGTARGWTVLGLIVLGALVVAALLRTEQWWWPLASVAL